MDERFLHRTMWVFFLSFFSMNCIFFFFWVSNPKPNYLWLTIAHPKWIPPEKWSDLLKDDHAVYISGLWIVSFLFFSFPWKFLGFNTSLPICTSGTHVWVIHVLIWHLCDHHGHWWPLLITKDYWYLLNKRATLHGAFSLVGSSIADHVLMHENRRHRNLRFIIIIIILSQLQLNWWS